MKFLSDKLLGRFGLHRHKTTSQAFPDLSPEYRNIMGRCYPYTMTSRERLAALCLAVEYITKNNIEGSFVECGVWKGGSMMATAWMLQLLGRTDADLFLYDTFEGMSEPTETDKLVSSGIPAGKFFAEAKDTEEGWCYSSLEEVKRNLSLTKHPIDRMKFIKGKVEDTIPAVMPEKIALLRLDTDWYESTRHEMIHLFPRLATGGVLIVDDYGHWTGAKKAIDEYVQENNVRLLLNRIDYTGRIAVKI